MTEEKVECTNHGLRNVAFVCQHLILNIKVGFNEPYIEEGEEQEDLNAWCDECDKILAIEREWNDVSENFAQIKLVCDTCYFEMKELNSK